MKEEGLVKEKEEINQVDLPENMLEQPSQPENNNKDKKEEMVIEKEQKEEAFEQVKGNTKKKVKQLQDKPKSKKTKIIVIISVLIILLALFLSTIFALLNMNQTNVLSGVKIEGIDMSGLSKEEAKGKLEVIYQEKLDKEIPVKYEEFEISINPTLIETNYQIDQAVEKAIEIGKSGNIFQNNYQIILAMLGKKDIDVEMTINEQAAKQSIEDLGTNLPGGLIESSYYREENNLIVTKGKEGIKINTDELLETVKQRLKDPTTREEYITIPVSMKQPETIDLQKIHDEIYKEVKDAYYTKDPFTIYPEVEGVDFNIDEAKAIIEAEDKEEYTIPLTITKPKITTSQIGTEAFPDRLSHFTTRYDASSVDRTTNLRLATQKINGKVILPGETFSYNKTLGERSIATGYKNAKVYENGEVVDGIGGGICQISSTLYNAVLMANLQVTERRNHQFVTSYLPAGRDATVVYGMTDFQFKNTRKYPVRISASVQNGIATVDFYGIKEEQEYTFSFETKTISTIPTSTKYVDDPTLPVGTEKVKQKGANGLKSETYMIKMLNGKIVSKELLSRDTYNAMQKIILRGTKGANTPQNNTPTTNKTNQNESTQPSQPTQNTNTNPTQSPEQNQTTGETTNTPTQNQTTEE